MLMSVQPEHAPRSTLSAVPEAPAPAVGEFDPAAALWALADPTRLQLVQRLARGPCSVSRLSEGLPVSRAAVSQHLKWLWRARLVSYRRSGPRNIYRLERKPLQELQAFVAQIDHMAAATEDRWRRLHAVWLERV
jgi:DNA-binding transcriptional ArsR family regulator